MKGFGIEALARPPVQGEREDRQATTGRGEPGCVKSPSACFLWHVHGRTGRDGGRERWLALNSGRGARCAGKALKHQLTFPSRRWSPSQNFEIPLLDTLDAYRRETSDRQLAHERALVAQTRALRQTEQDNLRQARSKRKTGAGAGSTVMSGRDLGSFRRTLELLQQQVDGLDRLKGAYYEEVGGRALRRIGAMSKLTESSSLFSRCRFLSTRRRSGRRFFPSLGWSSRPSSRSTTGS